MVAQSAKNRPIWSHCWPSQSPLTFASTIMILWVCTLKWFLYKIPFPTYAKYILFSLFKTVCDHLTPHTSTEPQDDLFRFHKSLSNVRGQCWDSGPGAGPGGRRQVRGVPPQVRPHLPRVLWPPGPCVLPQGEGVNAFPVLAPGIRNICLRYIGWFFRCWSLSWFTNPVRLTIFHIYL